MYRKEMYFFCDNQPRKGVIRNYVEQDFDQLIELQQESFPPPFPAELWWNKEQLLNHVTLFPEGALCAEIDGQIVGSITGLRIKMEEIAQHSWEEVTDNGYIRNHAPDGNTLYIVDICVRPSFRKYGIGKWLLQSMYEVVIKLNIERLLGGGRMPYYYKYAKTYTPQQYVEEVKQGKIYDPVITFLMKAGRSPVCVLDNYLEDEESLNYAVLMEWKNPFFTNS